MKKIKYIICCCLSLIFAFSSCEDYLSVDKYFNDMLTVDSAFTKRKYVEGFLSNAWERMYNCVGDIAASSDGKGDRGGNFMFVSDDLIFGNEGGDLCRVYQNCEYVSSGDLEDRWGRVYETIRKASVFIHSVDICQDMSLSERQDAKAQARFLRAYAYWVLVRQYGPMPLIPDKGLDVSMTYEELSIPRASYDECVEFITSEFAVAAQNLPSMRTSNNIGRPTKGAALAARAKVFLYAASPLFNGNTEMFDFKNKDGKQLINQTYDERKWALAAVAAKEVIDLEQYELLAVLKTDRTVSPPQNSNYSDKKFPEGWADIDPYESYSQIFNGELSPSKFREVIFTRPNDNAQNMIEIVQKSMPNSLGGSNTYGVTLKQVNAYEMNDGRSISAAEASGDYTTKGFTSGPNEYSYVEGANVSLMFVNREPRFYASIAYPGSIWECASAAKAEYRYQQIFYYKDSGEDGKSLSRNQNYVRTGIGLKKYRHPEDSWKEGGYRIQKYEPAIRYADVLLWYAEATNELTQSYNIPNYTETGSITVARNAEALKSSIKPIRMRAGVPDLADNIYNNQSQFRIALKHERQIELFAEAARYWDLRRWKDAPVEENELIMGLNVDMNGTDSQKQLFYNPTVVTSIPKIFLRKMYFWPIPSQSEMKRNVYLVQNPDWN